MPSPTGEQIRRGFLALPGQGDRSGLEDHGSFVWWHFLLVIAGGGVAMLTIGWPLGYFAPGLMSGPRGVFISIALALVLQTILWYGTLPWARRVRWKKFADVSLRKGLCPACGYDIDPLPYEHDRCVTCPECGAAWDAFRIGTRVRILPMQGPMQGSDS
ncbi:MAG: hypothetical protein SFY95_07265 [Planctomycetota bacterium]|nr:hypothetical protein [Planctomycetota bacterium]